MSSEPADFKLEVPLLDDAKAAYRTQGAGIQRELSTLWASATLPASAFGNLPQSRQFAAMWQRFHDQVSADLKRLGEGLTGWGDSLARCATDSHGVDEANAAAMRSVSAAVTRPADGSR
jgi:hypothetical protein